jgi:1,4-dihydroxy-2-naphthoyl-CoA hydrolase
VAEPNAATDGGGFTGTLMEKLGMEFLEVTPERIVARMPVAGNTQPYGLLHGGATAALCETIASIGTALLAGSDRMVMGIELNVNHLRGVTEGSVTATGVPLHVGRTTAVWDMRVNDDQGRLVAVSRLTLAIREPHT